LSKALLSIGRVDWRKVDPALSIRPKRNPHLGPFFHNGDHVPWNERGRNGGELDIVAELSMPEDAPIHDRGSRGERIRCVDLTRFREPTVGHGRRPRQWRGVFVDKARLSGATPQERATADRMRGKRPVRRNQGNPVEMAWTPRSRDRRNAADATQLGCAERPVASVALQSNAGDRTAPGTSGDTSTARLLGKRGLTLEPAWSVRKRSRSGESSNAQVASQGERAGEGLISMEDLHVELEAAKAAVAVENIRAASSITIHPSARELMSRAEVSSGNKGLQDFVNYRLSRREFPW